jgi:hypothetical protein
MSNLTMAICCPSTGGHDAAAQSWGENVAHTTYALSIDDATEGEQAGYLYKLQRFYQSGYATDVDVLGYMHSDLFIHEKGWNERVLNEFEADDVAIVSFGGSLRHGSPDLYRTPYVYTQLARSPFLSNMTDAEAHGFRETGARDVAVVDSMAFFVRRSFLDRIGGWPVATYPPNHCSDYWCCLMAHRHRQRIRMVGVSITHGGGGVGRGGFNYPAWAATTRWHDDATMHRVGHDLIYNDFRDVLPVEVK